MPIGDFYSIEDLTCKPGSVLQAKAAILRDPNYIAWDKQHNGYTRLTYATMDAVTRATIKHWMDMFIKRFVGWQYKLNPEDPFNKKSSFSITNGTYTIKNMFPNNEIGITPKLALTETSRDTNIGLTHTTENMNSFIGWAMGIEPLPKELQ